MPFIQKRSGSPIYLHLFTGPSCSVQYGVNVGILSKGQVGVYILYLSTVGLLLFVTHCVSLPLVHQAALQVGGHGERLHQCREVVLTTFKTVPVQVSSASQPHFCSGITLRNNTENNRGFEDDICL